MVHKKTLRYRSTAAADCPVAFETCLETTGSTNRSSPTVETTINSVGGSFSNFSPWRFDMFHTDSCWAGIPDEEVHQRIANQSSTRRITHRSFDQAFYATSNSVNLGTHAVAGKWRACIQMRLRVPSRHCYNVQSMSVR